MPKALKYVDENIRSHILTDVLVEVSVEDSYENLCKKMGNDATSFFEFQFWFHRFLKIKPELEFDENNEKEPLQFSDLPIDTVGLIVDKLELVDRLMLRHVSKPLRALIRGYTARRPESPFFEKNRFFYNPDFLQRIEKYYYDTRSIHINCSTDFIGLISNEDKISYAKNDETFDQKKKNPGFNGARLILENDYESEAFDDLAFIFKNPELKLERFSFYFKIRSQNISEEQNEMVGRCYKHFEAVLKSLQHQIAVKNLTIYTVSPDNLLLILPYLKPGYLEEIDIKNIYNCDSWKNKHKMQQIVSSEQWKQATNLEIGNLLELFPDEALTRFELLHIGEDRRQPGTLIRIRDILAKSDTLVGCCFRPRYDFEPEDFEIGVPGPPTNEASNVRLYTIPDSNQYVEFEFMDSDRRVDITKDTRE